MLEAGPVTHALEAELRELARQYGVIVWLDKEGSYTDYVRGLTERAAQGAFPFPVIAFDGSFLALLFELQGVEDGVDMRPLILHMPGYTEEEIAKTPAYELYRAGRRHRRAPTTLARDVAQGLVPPTAIEQMVGAGLPSLVAADAWLAGQLAGDAGPKRVQLPVLAVTALYDDMVTGGQVARELADPEMRAAVIDHLERTLGIDAAWRTAMGDGPLDRADTIAHVLSSWALS